MHVLFTRFCTLGTLLLLGHAAALGCGDGALQPGESCDDGNLDNGDGCSSFCLVEQGDYMCNTPGQLCARDTGAFCTVPCSRCGTNSDCAMLPNGGAVCTCRTGYARSPDPTVIVDPYNGLAANGGCVDIDECTFSGTPSLSTCPNKCVNTAGSYTCDVRAIGAGTNTLQLTVVFKLTRKLVTDAISSITTGSVELLDGYLPNGRTFSLVNGEFVLPAIPLNIALRMKVSVPRPGAAPGAPLITHTITVPVPSTGTVHREVITLYRYDESELDNPRHISAVFYWNPNTNPSAPPVDLDIYFTVNDYLLYDFFSNGPVSKTLFYGDTVMFSDINKQANLLDNINNLDTPTSVPSNYEIVTFVDTADSVDVQPTTTIEISARVFNAFAPWSDTRVDAKMDVFVGGRSIFQQPIPCPSAASNNPWFTVDIVRNRATDQITSTVILNQIGTAKNLALFCGNGARAVGEQCEGASASCVNCQCVAPMIPAATGNSCIVSTAAYCGNGIVDTASEECDGGALCVSCSCPRGTTRATAGNGCVEINECDIATYPAYRCAQTPVAATCSNPGYLSVSVTSISYCTCPPGSAGDGQQCTPTGSPWSSTSVICVTPGISIRATIFILVLYCTHTKKKNPSFTTRQPRHFKIYLQGQNIWHLSEIALYPTANYLLFILGKALP